MGVVVSVIFGGAVLYPLIKQIPCKHTALRCSGVIKQAVFGVTAIAVVATVPIELNRNVQLAQI